MDNYKQMMDTEHREEIDALTKEWSNEQKVSKIIITNLNCFPFYYFYYFYFDFFFRFYLFTAKFAF